MPEVSLQHIIGTVALIGLMISTGLFYTIFTTYVQDDNRKKELGQISENVALNIVEMINLAKFSKYSSEYMVKIIDLPIDIGGRAYKIQLTEDQVSAFLATQPTVIVNSTIPKNSGDISLKLNTSDTVYSGIEVGVDNLKISCSGTIYGKNGTVIWAFHDSGTRAITGGVVDAGGHLTGTVTGFVAGTVTGTVTDSLGVTGTITNGVVTASGALTGTVTGLKDGDVTGTVIGTPTVPLRIGIGWVEAQQ